MVHKKVTATMRNQVLDFRGLPAQTKEFVVGTLYRKAERSSGRWIITVLTVALGMSFLVAGPATAGPQTTQHDVTASAVASTTVHTIEGVSVETGVMALPDRQSVIAPIKLYDATDCWSTIGGGWFARAWSPRCAKHIPWWIMRPPNYWSRGW